MKQIQYNTGRTYDKPQILDILVESWGTDEWGIGVVTATFKDQSRHIQGRVVDAPVFQDDLGNAILSAYDNGHYTAI